MKVTIAKHRPELKHFALVLALTIALYTLLSVIVYLIFWVFASNATSREFWQYLSSSSGIWLFPAVGGIMHAFSFQRHELTITGIDDPASVADWAMNFLQKEGRQVISKDSTETVLASPNSYYRLFNYWLGAELVFIRYTADHVTVTGHYRHVDLIDSKIKFGKPAFN